MNINDKTLKTMAIVAGTALVTSIGISWFCNDIFSPRMAYERKGELVIVYSNNNTETLRPYVHNGKTTYISELQSKKINEKLSTAEGRLYD